MRNSITHGIDGRCRNKALYKDTRTECTINFPRGERVRWWSRTCRILIFGAECNLALIF